MYRVNLVKINEKMTNALRSSIAFKRLALKISKEITLARSERATLLGGRATDVVRSELAQRVQDAEAAFTESEKARQALDGDEVAQPALVVELEFGRGDSSVRGRLLTAWPTDADVPAAEPATALAVSAVHVDAGGLATWLGVHGAGRVAVAVDGRAARGRAVVDLVALVAADGSAVWTEYRTTGLLDWLCGETPKVLHDAKTLMLALLADGAVLGGVVVDTAIADRGSTIVVVPDASRLTSLLRHLERAGRRVHVLHSSRSDAERCSPLLIGRSIASTFLLATACDCDTKVR